MQRKMEIIMRKLWLLAAALAAIATPAAAQDKPAHHTGPYIGLMAGYGSNVISPDGAPFDWAGVGATGGAFAGYGVSVGNGLYVGVEGDVAMRDIKGKITDGVTSITASNDLMGTVRARLGYAAGPALLYVTGGLAVTQSKLAVSDIGADKNMIYGIVAGAGIEAELTRTLFVRIEGRHTRFQDETFTLQPGIAATVDRQADNTIFVGVGFKLN